MKLPPKQAFPHVISYRQYEGTDDWQKAVYGDSVALNQVRFDEGYNFNRSGENATDDAPNSLIVLFKKYNPNMPDFVNQSLIEFRDKTFTIVKAIPLYFMSDEIIGYELEVK